MEHFSEDIIAYCEQHSGTESELLRELNRETHLKQLYARMLSGHLQGRLLSMISKLLQPKTIIEIGTFTGYSAICLSEGLRDDGVLHTIEINPELEEIILKYFNKAGIAEKTMLHLGNAKEIIPTIPGPIDLAYIDADKENNCNYYKLLIEKLRPGGMILADNTLWDGKVLDEKATDKETKGVIEFNKLIQSDSRVEKLMLPFRDGITLVRKK